jgi:hypothetical protein
MVRSRQTWPSIAHLNDAVNPLYESSTSFSTNRDRLLNGEIAAKFLAAVLSQPRVKRLLSSQHFSVDGTLIEAWASLKSFKPKDHPSEGGDDPSAGGRNRPADFRGKKRSNTRPMAVQPIPMPGSIARDRAWRQSFALSATG